MHGNKSVRLPQQDIYASLKKYFFRCRNFYRL